MKKAKPKPPPKINKFSTVYSEEDETEWSSTESDNSNVNFKNNKRNKTPIKSMKLLFFK